MTVITPNEFKEWFENLISDLKGEKPSAEQWKQIKTKLAELNGEDEPTSS